MKTKNIFAAMIIFIVLVLAEGCASVQPWEKEPLTDPIMIINVNPIESGMKEHHLDYREGSTGSTGAQSGGCGCG